MSAEAYQYPPELFSLMVDTIAVLCRSKKDVILFFRGAGVPASMTADIEAALQTNRDSVKKHDSARTILTCVNEGGDALLAVRRELLKRVTEFEDFSRCYENDLMKAKGLVAEIRRVVEVKNSFTRMKQERDREAEARRAEQQRRTAAARERREKIAAAKAGLFALFAETNPHRRGKALENVLNDLFRAYGALVAEDFRRKGPGGGAEEQIDGTVLHGSDLTRRRLMVILLRDADVLGASELQQSYAEIWVTP